MRASDSPLGDRILVTGLSGSGKSTLSKALAARTGLPLIHLDLEFWKPGWVAPSDDEWSDRQRAALAGDAWIADGNYHETLALRLERPDTVVVLDTPWPLCSARAVRRGLWSTGGTMPDGCKDSVWRRLRDELPLALRIWRHRNVEPEIERKIIAACGQHTMVRVLRTKREASDLLAQLGG